MPTQLLKLSENTIFSLSFITTLTAALFYTGNNIWLFTISYILIILNVFLILKQRFYNSIFISVNGILISATLLLLWFAISIFTSQIKYLSLYNFFWVGSLIVIFLIFTFHSNKDQIWNKIWPGIILLVTLWALYGLFQHYYLHAPTDATFLNKNTLAALINLVLIPASAYFLIDEKIRPWKFLNNKILTLILVTLFLTLFVIASRGATLSLTLGFIILLFLIKKHVIQTKIYFLLLIAIIAFLIVTLSQYFFQNTPAAFTERMISLQNTSTAGNARFIIWNSLIPLFYEMPWYGLGLGSLWMFWPPHRQTNDLSAGFFAHNDYMQLTLEAGYPGITLLFTLFLFILISFIRSFKNKNNLTLLQQTELFSLFSALITFATHSFFTYNFYVFPLLLISGIYLGRFNQLININSTSLKNIPSLKHYFKPIMFYFSLAGFSLILCSYFLAIPIADYYNQEAKNLMKKNKFQESNSLFLKAQLFAPLMDSPFFSHADLLRIGANKLLKVNKVEKANSLLKSAHKKLEQAKILNPLRPQTHHIRGLIYKREQPEKAKVEFKKALKLNPRFLYSRINLASLHYQERQLDKAIKILHDGVNYNYPINQGMLKYMNLYARYSREAGEENFALQLEKNIKQYVKQTSKLN